ncbi:helix-turn-helix domain-containing protein [Pseudomonas sp. ZM23]|uniref:Helix-turn-helix transcriptional regulator n=1 Tax=Pseudomonas triclosanedens TaxID=2961893 RepID=A0ABY7A342_9PSED|nr:helix-turn-helix transcriptional regulator [Pseudomonas triclosanedens]MCP8467914.1 helix-turn-helix domain-containing protein [Pseudomonas triclosanedens]MCP8473890.1 helix-turn-helix domain-containing protein [Pseudomonas triclosanedens]MCP8479892.1 helix-turn-helix domain-containing protein [Pseudomonas triclosanedens]WAI51305.1 helix-turn-helix transcriptional regulator [Pseudomonas triclosanedens]
MIRARLIAIWDKKGLSATELEKLTGIDRSNWYSLRNGRRRANEDDIAAIAEAFPEYAYWLVTGKLAPSIGQTSPDYDEADKKLQAPSAG